MSKASVLRRKERAAERRRIRKLVEAAGAGVKVMLSEEDAELARSMGFEFYPAEEQRMDGPEGLPPSFLVDGDA